MQVVYVGPCDAVTVDGRLFVRNVPQDAHPELVGREPSGDDPGTGLLAQHVWAQAPAADVPVPDNADEIATTEVDQ